MSLATRILTALTGQLVGSDSAGNRYYRGKNRRPGGRERRWVLYNGEVEASRVPPEWHAWLHHTIDDVPPEGGSPKRPWQKEHLPNQTGTPNAYRPPGHVLKGGRRDRATGDYEPWHPN